MSPLLLRVLRVECIITNQYINYYNNIAHLFFFTSDMEFSDFYKHSSYLTKFSPDGLYIATVYQNRLAVRDSITLKVLNVNQSDAAIEHVNWSPDSHFFLAASYTAGTVYIGCIGENSWSAVIEEGTAGLKHARWTPDGRGIMCFSDFRVNKFSRTYNRYGKPTRCFIDHKFVYCLFFFAYV